MYAHTKKILLVFLFAYIFICAYIYAHIFMRIYLCVYILFLRCRYQSKSFITKCGMNFLRKCDSLLYYKVQWIQTATAFFFVLLQSATGFITLRQELQNVTIITACNSSRVPPPFLHRPSPP